MLNLSKSLRKESNELNRDYLEEKYKNLPTITNLNLSNQKWKTIMTDTFKSLKELTRLKLDTNQIEVLDPKLFESLTSLKELWLNGNKLSRIDSDTFKTLNKLDLLVLYTNQIEFIEATLFAGLTNLRELWLNDNKLNRINSDTFKPLTRLELLSLRTNQIEVIEPMTFEGLANLKRLELQNNQLKQLRNDTFKSLSRLEIIGLNDNKIQAIVPKLFEGLLNLRQLWLNGNKLNHIYSDTFKSLTKLEILVLHTNHIEVVEPKVFEGLSNLKELWLSKNHLIEIKSDLFKSLSKLETLVVHTNQIESIELEAFKSQPNLKQLWLNGNKLERIRSDTFRSLTRLEILVLHTNQIQVIESNSFSDLANLKELWLYGNKLDRIESDTFKLLINLELLVLNDNEIDVIESGSFESLTNLKELYLDGNRLKSVSRSCFKHFTSIGFILLNNNNFDTNIESYFSRAIFEEWKPDHKFHVNSKPHSISEYESFLSRSLPFTSDFSLFLNQFPDVSNLTSPFKNVASNLNIVVDNPSTNNDIQPTETQATHFASLNSLSNDLRLVVPIDDPYVGKTFRTYLIVKPLGKGAFGQVYLVNDQRLNKNKSKKAMKIMDLDEIAQNEINILTRLDHENILKYLEHFEVDTGSNLNYKQIKLCIVTEFCEKGDLKTKIEEKVENKEYFKPIEIFIWILQATSGLKYLHSLQPKGIIHRDIKPKNILLTKDSVIKLADLGLSRITNNTRSVYSIAGTREYISPEMYRCLLDENQSYSFKTDIWSLGCVLYEMMKLTKVFPSGQESDPPIPDLGTHRFFSPILKKMLEKKENDRVDSNHLYEELLISARSVMKETQNTIGKLP